MSVSGDGVLLVEDCDGNKKLVFYCGGILLSLVISSLDGAYK